MPTTHSAAPTPSAASAIALAAAGHPGPIVSAAGAACMGPAFSAAASPAAVLAAAVSEADSVDSTGDSDAVWREGYVANRLELGNSEFGRVCRRHASGHRAAAR